MKLQYEFYLSGFVACNNNSKEKNRAFYEFILEFWPMSRMPRGVQGIH